MLHTTPATTADSSTPMRAIGLWVIFCTFCNCIGWLLSSIHQLNAAGYATAFGVAIAGTLIFWRRLTLQRAPGLSFNKLRRRFSRFFPATFALLAALAILGGFLHRPSNPDGLTQRIPHSLNWLAQGRWHWIENAPSSFNSHAVGFEWL